MASQRIIGIDYGKRRIGLSLSDPTFMLASPQKTFEAGKKLPETAKKLMDTLEQEAKTNHYSIKEIVIGLPLLLSGKKGELALEVEQFIEELKKITSVPITPWDERLTSVQAERQLQTFGMNRKKRSQRVDPLAAVIILQSYLDAKYPH